MVIKPSTVWPTISDQLPSSSSIVQPISDIEANAVLSDAPICSVVGVIAVAFPADVRHFDICLSLLGISASCLIWSRPEMRITVVVPPPGRVISSTAVDSMMKSQIV